MTADTASIPPPTRRLVLGVVVFALGWIAALVLASLVSATSLSASAQTTVSAVLVFIVPKVGVLGAIAIMGKPGFTYLKQKIFGYLKPPAEVSPTRHRIGVAMFVTPILVGVLESYVGALQPESGRHYLYSVASDAVLLASIFVLGGDFWDKLRALFIRDAKAQFPA